MATQFDPLQPWIRRGYSESEARSIVAWLLARRQALQRAPRRMIGSSAEKRNTPRFIREVVRRHARKFYRYTPLNVPKLVLAAQFKPNTLLDGIYPNRQRSWTPIMRRSFI